jgi:HK97 family phage major capsid protein
MNIVELKHKYDQLMTQANALAVAGFTAESRTKFDAVIADSDVLHADIQRAEKLEKFESEQRSTQAPPRAGFETRTEDQKQIEVRNFVKWMRTGQHETRDMGDAASGLTTGSQFVPTLIAPLVDAKKSYGNLLDYVNIFRTETGGQINIPLTDDVSNAITLISGQGTSATTSTDPTVSSVASNTDTAQTLLKISNELLQDSYFDLENWVRTKLNVRWARGFTNWISQGNSSNVAALAANGGVTSATSGVVAYPDLAALYGSLDQAYAGTASWVMSSATRASLMGLVSTTGQPILQPSPNGDPFGAIFGRPICFDINRPAIAAGNVPIFFGDLSEGYTARIAGFVVKRLDELFSLSNETGFVLYSRVSGVVTDAGTHPVKALTVHA